MDYSVNKKFWKKLNKNNFIIFIIIFLILLVLFTYFFLITKKSSISKKPMVKEGELDLKKWDFKSDGIVNLNGEWEFYWQKLLSPANFSEGKYFQSINKIKKYSIDNNNFTDKGYFTYRLKVDLDEISNNRLALKLPRTAGTSIKVWINDQLKVEEGKVARNKMEMNPGWESKIIDFEPEDPNFEIVIQGSNYHNYRSGLAGNIKLGTYSQIRSLKEKGLALNIFLFGSLLIIAFYSLILYILRYNDIYLLYFGLLVLIISIWTAASGEAYLLKYFNFSYNLVYKLLLSRYLAVPLFSLLLASLFPKKFSQKILILNIILGVAFYLYILLFPPEVTTNTLTYNLLSIVFFSYSFYIMLKTFLLDKNPKRQKKASVFLFSLTILFFTIANDYLNYKDIIDTTNYLGIVVWGLLLVQSIYISKMSTAALTKVESLSNKLDNKNKMLKKINKFKNEFIVETVKEIKSPLFSIISSAESVLHENAFYLKDNAKDNLANIINKAQKLDYESNIFIDYLKIKKENINFSKEKIEIYDLMKEVTAFFKPKEISNKIKINNNIKQNEYIVIGDEKRLIQIIYNILSDINEFIKSGELRFSAQKKDNNIELKIEVKASKIFFKYKNINIKSKENNDFLFNKLEIKQQVTDNLLKLQGGELKVEKSGNESLIFRILLPGEEYNQFYKDNKAIVSKNRQKNDTEVKNKKENQKKKDKLESAQKSILIIGDKSDKYKSLKDILVFQDYNIYKKENSKETLNYLNEKVSLVVINVFYLDESALKLCKDIRDRFTLFELPILMMVSRSQPGDLIKGFELGINDFIKKPFEISELKARIRTLINLKEKVEESFKREQDYLRAQIQPHFLYNTLDTIAHLCHKNQKKAHDLIISLAGYLRYSFDFDSLNQLIPIKKELDLVKFYITIQKARFKNKIQLEYNIEVELDFRIPPLILQSLVENAVKHGIVEKEDGGKVIISIKKESNNYLISVEDNGVGMSEKEISQLLQNKQNENRKGVGLKNINKRLKKLYNQKLVIKSKKGKGTTVEFKIPDISSSLQKGE